MTARWAYLADLVAVIVFTTIGRLAHDESDGLAGIIVTTWPFAVALTLGWLVVRRAGTPLTVRAALPLWAITVFGGMVLRLLAGQGVEVAFVVVAAAFLGLFLLGWRLLAGWAARLRRPAPRSRPGGTTPLTGR